MGQVRQVTEPAAWVPSPAVRTAGVPTIAWDRIVLSLVAALAVVMVCYPVAFAVLRSVSKADIGSRLTLEWLVAALEFAA